MPSPSTPPRLAVLLSVALFGACHSPPPAQPDRLATKTALPDASAVPPASASAKTMPPARVKALAEFVSTLRGHPFDEPLPPVRFVARDQLPKIPGVNGELTQVRVSARYFDDRHEIVVAEDLETHPELDATIVHELVHALMKARGIKPFIVETGLSKEALFAWAALVEGDANLVEEAYRVQQNGGHPRRTMAGATRVQAPWLPLACRADSDPLRCGVSNATQEEGRAFASALYRVGGTSLIDAVHRARPETSHEILFPDLYLAGVKERDLGAELEGALAKADVDKKLVEQGGAFRMGDVFSREAPVDVLRSVLRDLRGDAIATVDPRGQVLLTEWSDTRAAARFAKIAQAHPSSIMRPVGDRRLIVGIDVPRETVEAIAKQVSPTPAALPAEPPLGRAIAVPLTWEEELAGALLREGTKGFAKVGVDPGKALRASATSTTWLSPKDDKLFVLPTTAPVLNRKLIIKTLEKAWGDAMEGLAEPTLPEEVHLPIGTIRLTTAAFAMPSMLYAAIARVPICAAKPQLETLLVVKFGADPNVKASLVKDLESWRPAANAARSAVLCARIEAESAELTPPAF